MKKGVCYSCGEEPASLTCKLCGALVGPACYDSVTGTCIKCRAGRMAP
jgi:hypothetical protein